MDVLAIFGIGVLMSFVSSVVVAALYVWPRLRKIERDQALATLVTPHAFLRFLGLSFLVPGVVSPSLPAGFAVPAASGDFVAGVLALSATIALARQWRAADAAVWAFNVWGAADLLFAFYRGSRVQLAPGSLGAGFLLITVLVPALLVTHGLIFGLLLQPQARTIAERT